LITLDGGRIGIGAQALGIAKGALKRTLAYVQEREQFSKKLSSFEALQFKLADMAVKIRAAELLIYDAAERKMKGLKNKFESSAAKLYAAEMAMQVTKDAIQLHGGYGYIKEYEVERFWRDAKLLEIGEGTSEIQRLVIFRELIKNPNLFL
jgi:alkylation response protein AidB-like acyl-CoA dehydrogenase